MRKQGIDLDFYTTNQIAADINDLVNVLGIEEYNLLTMSYSTKIAQVLVRDYPDRIRSVVMDSPLPLEVNYDEESVNNLLGALDKLLCDCQADADCKNALSKLKVASIIWKKTTNNPLRSQSRKSKVTTTGNFLFEGRI